MPSKEFIFQGLTYNGHAGALERVFAVPGLSRAWLSVAFVTSGGVAMAAPVFAPHAGATTVFAGVRNGVTSVQGMKALLALGVRLYAVDTGRATLVFHPKVYAATGPAKARLLVGSANLTAGGLQNNVEASLLVRLDLEKPADRALLDGLTDLLDALPGGHPRNVTMVTTASQLDAMLSEGRLIDETAPAPPSLKSSVVVPRAAADSVPVMKTVGTQAAAGRPKTVPAKKPKPTLAQAKAALSPVPASYVEVWRMDGLKHRDLNIARPGRKPGAKTNLTGSINLDKGALPDDVAFQTYFRTDVFAALDWKMGAKGVETATAHFRVIVKGIDRGDYVLTVRHSTSAKGTEDEGNALSRLSWGPAKPSVADPSLIGRSLTLSRDASDPHRFLIDID